MRAGNQILAALSPREFAQIEQSLSLIPLRVRDVLEETHGSPDHVYFPLSGIISVVAGPASSAVEVGIIGRDGMTGSWAVLGEDVAACTSFVQVDGEALRLDRPVLMRLLEDLPTFRGECLKSVGRLLTQTSETAWSNARSSVTQRLARWLMLCSERIDGDAIPMTHAFLSVMLGVRRPGVTLAIQTLEGMGMIKNSRGRILLRNRKLLDEYAAKALLVDGGSVIEPRP
jgi:CRP-like cAMP-binding protein